MKRERMIEILAEEMNKADHNKISIEERVLRINRCDVGENIVLGHSTALTAITRAVEEEENEKQQAEIKSAERFHENVKLKSDLARLRERVAELQHELFEKENNPNYQSDLTRLRQCEAIVRELAKDNDFIEVVLLRRKSKEWVRENPEPKPAHKPGCYIYMQGGECNCDLI